MMRLVFLFCAEERELLLLGDELYDKNYAVSTLREQLRKSPRISMAKKSSGLRYDAWSRLLTTFRAVYAGSQARPAQAPGLRRQPVQSRPFPVPRRPQARHKLEGHRCHAAAGQQPHSAASARSPPIASSSVAGRRNCRGPQAEFPGTDIEQIGHVYEGLLDHTAKRATEPVLGLQGTRDKEPEIALAELEKLAAKGEKELLKFLKDATGRSESAFKKALNAELDDQLISRFRTACQDLDLWKRVEPFAGLVRLDTNG